MHAPLDPWSTVTTEPAGNAKRTTRTWRGAEALTALAPAWRDLDARAQACPADLGLCRAALGDQPDDALRVVTVHEGERLVGLWPLRRSRVGPLRQVQRLARGLQATDGPTLAEGCDAAGICRAAWAEVAGWRDVDVVLMSALDAAHPLAGLPAVSRAARAAATTCTIDLTELEDAAGFVARRKKRERGSLRRRRRKLEAVGTVRFEALVDPSRRRAATAAALDHKAAWLDAQEAVSPTFRAPWFRQGLLAAAADPDSRHLCVSQLMVGERAVAWEIGHRDGATYRSFLAAYDPALAELGTGVALQLEVIGWCAQQGLRTYDLLPPHTDFKARWASDTATVLTAVVPLRRRAAMLVPLLRDGRAGLKRLVSRLPDSVQTTAWRLARARQSLGAG